MTFRGNKMGLTWHSAATATLSFLASVTRTESAAVVDTGVWSES